MSPTTSIFPSTAVTDFTGTLTSTLAANIAVVLGILAFVFALKWIMSLFNKSTRGHL